MFQISILLVVLCFFNVLKNCNSKQGDDYLNERGITFISNYMNWQNIKHVIVVDDVIQSASYLRMIGRNMDLFTVRNIFISFSSSIPSFKFLRGLTKYKIGIVVFIKNNKSGAEVIEQVNKIIDYGEYISWLVMSMSNETNIINMFSNTDIRLNTNLVLVMMYEEEYNRNQQIENNLNKGIMTEYGNQTNIFLPFLNNTTSRKFCQHHHIKKEVDFYCLLQIYKIRKNLNISLAIYELGIWTNENDTNYLRSFLPITKRNNFYGFPLILGQRNVSHYAVEEEMSVEYIYDGDYSMADFFDYISNWLNTRYSVVNYLKLGSRHSDGRYTDLFGALLSEEIDMSFDCIVKTSERIQDMYFTFDILKSQKNIYMRPQRSEELRNIFRQAFGERLLFCVVITVFMFSIAMTVNSLMTNKIYKNLNEDHPEGFIHSIIWSVGVFAQQGSILQPILAADRLLIMVAMLFTLIIYNSYSAFITSILSVTKTNIQNVDDLLASGYEIGYTKNSHDEVYLRLMNYSLLNQIYLRGYLHNEIKNTTEGLMKATEGNFGFFASGQMARKQFMTISNHKCVYDLFEMQLRFTITKVAFAMSSKTPYKKLINMSIIKMYENGIYKYLFSLIYPDFPECQKLKTYESARLTDVSIAFLILVIGAIIAIIFLIYECISNRKNTVCGKLKKKFRQNLIKNENICKKDPILHFDL